MDNKQALCPVRSQGPLLAWAADRNLVIFNATERRFELNVDTSAEGHSDTIRSISISTDGSTIATAGEDKRVIVWSKTNEWQPVRIFMHTKKVMVVEILVDGSVVFADKFGDFFRLKSDNETHATPAAAESEDSDADETSTQTELLFGHLAAVSTALYSAEKQLLVSADRDEKIRLTKFPKVWNIESFLFGHKRYVSSLAWFGLDGLVSAGADGIIILWDISDSGSPRKIWSLGIGDGPVNSVTVNGDKVLVIRADEPNKLYTIVDGAIVDTCELPSAVQSVHALPDGRVASIDVNSHLVWLNGDRVPIAADVPGVPITLMKVVHHENFGTEKSDGVSSGNKRTKREEDNN